MKKQRRKALRFRSKGKRKSIPPKMALTPRCRAGGGGGGSGGSGNGGGGENNLSEELANEDEGANAANFEPLSDSCGESDMEGLDLSLFEPQIDTASWCDSRIHAGTLHILVHYCGKLCEFHRTHIYTYIHTECCERRSSILPNLFPSGSVIRIGDFVTKYLHARVSNPRNGGEKTRRARALLHSFRLK